MFHEFNAKEILEMARQIEKNGATFYQNAAEDVADSKVKDVLSELAEMELKHEQIFAEMIENLSPGDSQEVVLDPFEETAAYIQALTDTRVFYEKKVDTSSAKEILKAAIIAEKESILFYVGMKEIVAEETGKAKVGDIIREEMGHIQLIHQRLKELG